MTLHTELHDLTVDQPAQPVDRLAAVTSRARRIRRTRATVSAVAVAAVLAGGATLTLGDAGRSTSQFASHPVTSWPDRSTSDGRSVAEGAKAMFAATGGDVTDLRWLYRGRVDHVSQTGDDWVAVFTAEKDGQRVLVASHANAEQVDDNGLEGRESDGSYPWISRVVPVAEVGDHVGIYLSGPRESTGLDGQLGQVGSSALFVLADPDARTLRFTQRPVPSAPTDNTTPEGFAESRNGVFVTIDLVLTGPVDITLEDGTHAAGEPSAAGTGQDTPELLTPARPDVPAAYVDRVALQAQAEQSESGLWTGTNHEDFTSPDHAPLSVFVRCYGGGVLKVDLKADQQVSSSLSSGSAPCDNASHQVVVDVPRTHSGYVLTTEPDRLQAFTVVVAARR